MVNPIHTLFSGGIKLAVSFVKRRRDYSADDLGGLIVIIQATGMKKVKIGNIEIINGNPSKKKI